MSEIDLNDIKPKLDSKANTFEELVCQLAKKKYSDYTYKRYRQPDGGIEASLIKDEEMIGIQAKYYKDINSDFKKEVKNSFKTALTNYPNLTGYIVCFPFDLSKPNVGSSQQWEDLKKDLESMQEQGKQVKITYWGKSEIITEVAKPENRGLAFFFFEKEVLNKEWFKDHLDKAIAGAGPRYTPKVNIKINELDYLNECFSSDGSEDFKSIYKKLKDIKKVFENDSDFIELKDLLEKGSSLAMKGIECDLKVLVETIKKLSQYFRDCSDKQFKLISNQESKEIIDECLKRNKVFSSYIGILDEITDSLENKTSIKLGKPVCLIGKAGSGKTHFMTDLAQERISGEDSNFKPTIIIFAGKLNPLEDIVYSKIPELLHLDCKGDDFYNALEASGEAYNQDVLIMIDALNESINYHKWSEEEISKFIKISEKHKRIRIMFSTRCGFEDIIFKDHIKKKDIHIVEHKGFEGQIFDAVKSYFKFYNINLIGSPILDPEFRNPLFLKLFCETNRGVKDFPIDCVNIYRLFEPYFGNINERLSTSLDYDIHCNYVQKAIKAIIKHHVEKIENGEPRHIFLKKDLVKSIIDSVVPDVLKTTFGYSKSLFRGLISEGLISEEYFYISKEDTDQNYLIRISYQFLDDYLVVEDYMEKHFHPDNPENSFKVDSPLGQFFTKEKAWGNTIHELLPFIFVYIAKKTGKELFDFINTDFIGDFSSDSLIHGFIESLSYRTKDHFTDKTFDYIDLIVLKNGNMGQYSSFIDLLLNCSIKKEHPLNIIYSNKLLSTLSLCERDRFWTQELSTSVNSTNYKQTCDVLIDWVYDWKCEDKEIIYLVGLTLSWFLGSPNRLLRDKSSKALVKLLTGKTEIIIKLLKEFEKIDDTYIQERIWAVAYGCSMRDHKDLDKLADYAYYKVFKENVYLPHILIRDFARGIIELALKLDLISNVKLKTINPPYKSTWPITIEVRDLKDKDYYDNLFKQNNQKPWNSIFRSVLYGDFATYTMSFGYNDNDHRFRFTGNGIKEVDTEETAFQSDIAKRWILERIISYGFKPEFFEVHDHLFDYSRARSTHDRFGKKYQYMAFYEAIARISDNYRYRDKSGESSSIKYEGPWQLMLRNFDPSYVHNKPLSSNNNTWWIKKTTDIDKIADARKWFLDKSEYIDPKQLMDISRDGKRYIPLYLDVNFKSKKQNFERYYGFSFLAYIINKNEMGKLEKISQKQVADLIHPFSTYSIYLGEHYRRNCSKTEEIIKLKVEEHKKILKLYRLVNFVHSTSDDNNVIFGEGLDFILPSKYLTNIMNLEHNMIDNYWFNNPNQIIVFDPRFDEPGQRCLLADKVEIMRMCNEENKMIVIFGISERFADNVGREIEYYIFKLTDSEFELVSKKSEGE